MSGVLLVLHGKVEKVEGFTYLGHVDLFSQRNLNCFWHIG